MSPKSVCFLFSSLKVITTLPEPDVRNSKAYRHLCAVEAAGQTTNKHEWIQKKSENEFPSPAMFSIFVNS